MPEKADIGVGELTSVSLVCQNGRKEIQELENLRVAKTFSGENRVAKINLDSLCVADNLKMFIKFSGKWMAISEISFESGKQKQIFIFTKRQGELNCEM